MIIGRLPGKHNDAMVPLLNPFVLAKLAALGIYQRMLRLDYMPTACKPFSSCYNVWSCFKPP